MRARVRHAINGQTMKPVCGGGGEHDMYVFDMTRVTCKACQDGVDAEWRRLGQEPKNVWTTEAVK